MMKTVFGIKLVFPMILRGPAFGVVFIPLLRPALLSVSTGRVIAVMPEPGVGTATDRGTWKFSTFSSLNWP